MLGFRFAYKDKGPKQITFFSTIPVLCLITRSWITQILQLSTEKMVGQSSWGHKTRHQSTPRSEGTWTLLQQPLFLPTTPTCREQRGRLLSPLIMMKRSLMLRFAETDHIRSSRHCVIKDTFTPFFDLLHGTYELETTVKALTVSSC